MTPLSSTHTLTPSLCLLLALGCSSHVNLAVADTGGSTNASVAAGGNSSNGGGPGGSGPSAGTGSGTGGANGGSDALDAAVVGPGCSTTTWPASWQSGVLDIPTGPNVTSMIGAGSVPTPHGGIVTAGSYWLVAETVYGYVPPSANFIMGVPGQTFSSELAVSCDVFAQAVQDGQGSGFGEYGPLVPQALSLGIPWDGSVPYTATNSTLSLIMVNTYGNPGVTLGTYTVVDDYVLVSDGVAVGTAPQRLTGDAGTVTSQARDPRCPTTVPDAGTACDLSTGPLECEYGGDALGRCTQSTACALQTDGSYRFQSYPSTGCDPNPANCPASFSAADATSGIITDAGNCEPSNEFLCNYPESVCNCGSVSSTLACRCIAPGNAQAYRSQLAPDGGNPCPAQRPLSGDGCTTEGLWCLYDDACSPGFSLGASMACMRGYWGRLDLSIPCVATTPCP